MLYPSLYEFTGSKWGPVLERVGEFLGNVMCYAVITTNSTSSLGFLRYCFASFRWLPSTIRHWLKFISTYMQESRHAQIRFTDRYELGMSTLTRTRGTRPQIPRKFTFYQPWQGQIYRLLLLYDIWWYLMHDNLSRIHQGLPLESKQVCRMVWMVKVTRWGTIMQVKLGLKKMRSQLFRYDALFHY